MKLFGDRGTAHDRSSLKDPHATPRLREIERAHQGIVATADQNEVVLHHRPQVLQELLAGP